MSLPSVPVHDLGKQGLKASIQGLGCMGMSAFYTDKTGHEGETESIKTIHRALELGVTFLDTSDVYGPFTNEELVGKAIKGRRGEVTLATKCGIIMVDGGMAFDGSRKHVREACEASLKRLGTDYIDLYYLHRVDPKISVTETFAEMKALVSEGKVKYVGISEASPADIRAAHAVCPLSAVQLEWSLWSRDSEEDLVPVCRELGIGIVAYSPLGRGLLTGIFTRPEDLPEDDWRRTNPRFQGEAFKKNLELLNAVKELAAQKGCTPGQLALAWVHAQGDDVFTIPGTKRVKYLEENIGALAVKFSDTDLQHLGKLADQVVGDRYENMQATTYHYGKAAI
eukprot:GHRR01022724.1.p1 GENE.GHRR01022724.1~~GHRR01022724.1.p1  ORF type:complete len:339 (+),score=103.68 GHRR01022724.1:511-1527(+)